MHSIEQNYDVATTVAWTLGGLIYAAIPVIYFVAFYYLKTKRERDVQEDAADPLLLSKAVVKSSQFQAFKTSMHAMTLDEIDEGTLHFRSEEMEQEYVKFNIATLCTHTVPLTMAAVVKAIWEMTMFDPNYDQTWQLVPTFLRWDTAPVVLYNAGWIAFIPLSLLLLFLCTNPLFRRSTAAERTVVIWTAAGILIFVLLGNRWRISRLCGYPRPPVSDFPSYQDSDQKLILALLMTFVYLAMYVPVRFSRLRLLGAFMGLLYPLSTLFLGNPANGHFTLENLLMFDGMVVLVLLGQRVIEKQRRVAFLALVETFERFDGQQEKALLF